MKILLNLLGARGMAILLVVLTVSLLAAIAWSKIQGFRIRNLKTELASVQRLRDECQKKRKKMKEAEKNV